MNARIMIYISGIRPSKSEYERNGCLRRGRVKKYLFINQY